MDPWCGENMKNIVLKGFICLMGIFGVIIVLHGTSLYGIGISPDSVVYISGARNLLNGNGFVTFTESPIIGWPPLYPAVLALIGIFGFDPLVSARFFNAILFGCIVTFSCRLFYIYIKSSTLVVFATLSILFSVPIMHLAFMAWSETLFVFLIIIFLIYLHKFLNKGDTLSLLVTSLSVALACLDRYIGITLIASGIMAILLLSSVHELSKKIKCASIFALISCLPLTLWLLRNYHLSSTFTGSRLPSSYTLLHYINKFIDVLTMWFIPPTVSLSVRVMIVLFTGLIVISITIQLCFKRGKIINSITWNLPLFSIVYILFLLFSCSLTNLDPVPYRYLAPIYPALICLFFMGLENVSCWLSKHLTTGKLRVYVIVLICSFWLTHPVLTAYKYVQRRVHKGAGYFTSVKWKESPLIERIHNQTINGTIYSNAPDAIYILCGINANWCPRISENLSVLKIKSTQTDNYLVWFNNVFWRSSYYNLKKISLNLELEETERFPDGNIYRIR